MDIHSKLVDTGRPIDARIHVLTCPPLVLARRKFESPNPVKKRYETEVRALIKL